MVVMAPNRIWMAPDSWMIVLCPSVPINPPLLLFPPLLLWYQRSSAAHHKMLPGSWIWKCTPTLLPVISKINTAQVGFSSCASNYIINATLLITILSNWIWCLALDIFALWCAVCWFYFILIYSFDLHSTFQSQQATLRKLIKHTN